jgi:glutamine amidotransferase
MKNIPYVAIVDYGMGNIMSVSNALEFLKVNFRVSQSEQDLELAQALLFPGVGAFGEAITNIQNRGLDKILKKLVIDRRRPVLGICLGMQLMFDSSDENGDYQGLGFIKGNVKAISIRSDLPVPHVGWNEVCWSSSSRLTHNIPTGAHFYFDHSYEVLTSNDCITATTEYGVDITATVEVNNIFATQFHPEKSQVNGLRVINNFLKYSEVI